MGGAGGKAGSSGAGGSAGAAPCPLRPDGWAAIPGGGFNGPTTDSNEWMAYFIVHAPRDASLNLEAKNGPIEVRGVNGTIKLRAANGPIAIAD